MKKTFILISAFSFLLIMGCRSKTKTGKSDPDQSFSAFEDRFLDAYWNQYPAASINITSGAG